ncbi:MAG: hypothetical protein ACFB21_12500 [Opitutales bacterium]
MLSGIIWTLVNVLATAFAAMLVVCRLHAFPAHRWSEGWTAFGLVWVTLLTVSASLLGYGQLLTPAALTLVAIALALAAAWWRRGHIVMSLVEGRRLAREPFRRFQSLPAGLRIVLGVSVVLILTQLLGALVLPPIDFDSHGYRLSRIGLWLQEAAVYQTPTTDTRMNYSPINGDLLMLWLTSPFSSGYPLTKLVQCAAGLYLAVVLHAFARRLGLRREARVALLPVMLGLPVLLHQMNRTQVDLLVAAMATGGLLFLLLSLRGRASPWFAWLGLAQAYGVKGTMFYWSPGLLVLGLCWAWVFKPSKRMLSGQAVAAIVCLLVVAAPRYLENVAAYGNPFAPADDIAQRHGDEEPGGGADLEKLRLNTLSYLAQALMPRNNPPVFDPVLGPTAAALTRQMPSEADPHTMNRPRQVILRQELGNLGGNFALEGSTGILILLTGLAGVGVQAYRRRGRIVRLWLFVPWLLSVLSFFAVLSGLFLWTPFKSRFFLLVIPVLILGSALGTSLLRGRNRYFGVLLVSCLFLLTGLRTTWTDYSSLPTYALGDPPTSIVATVVNAHARIVAEELQPGDRVAVSLPEKSFRSAFFRTGKDLEVSLPPLARVRSFEGPEAALEGMGVDALVVPEGTFAPFVPGLYSRADHRITGAFRTMNTTLYRRLREGEAAPRGVVLNHRRASADKGRWIHELLWQAADGLASAKLSLTNLSTLTVQAVVLNEEGEIAVRVRIAPGGTRVIEVAGQGSEPQRTIVVVAAPADQPLAGSLVAVRFLGLTPPLYPPQPPS